MSESPTDSGTDSKTDSDGPSRTVLIATLLFALTAVGVVLAVVASHQGTRHPVAIAAVPAPHADDPACNAVLSALPERLGDYRRAAVADPAPHGAAAWQAGPDGEPIVLRCGLDRPDDFVVGSPIQVVDSVQWFQVRTDGRSTWYAVDRPVYLALTLPPGAGPTPIQQLSELIERTVAVAPIRPAPAR